MQKLKSIKFNFMMSSLLSVSRILFPLITFPYVSRILLPVGMGKVSFATAILANFTLISQLGIPTYGIRECAKYRNNMDKLSLTVKELFIINLLMCIFVYIIFGGTLFMVPRIFEEQRLFIIMSFTIVLNLIGVEWLYRGLEQYTYITARSVIFNIISLVLMFLLIHDEKDYVVYGLITVLSSSGSYIVNFLYLHKFVNFLSKDKLNIKRHLKPVFVFFAMSVAITVYTSIDITMLGFIKSDVDVGYYNSAVRIKTLLATFVASLGTVLLPRASFYLKKDMVDKFEEISKTAVKFTIVTAFPLMWYFMFYAQESILFLGGESFGGSTIPMIIIMPTVLFIGLTNVMGTEILVSLDQEKKVFLSVVSGASVDIILNFIFIPSLSASGAALGTLFAEITVFLIQLYYVHKLNLKIFSDVYYFKIVFSTLIALIFSIWIKYLDIPIILRLVLSFGIFSIAYMVVLYFLKEPLIRDIFHQVSQKIKSEAHS